MAAIESKFYEWLLAELPEEEKEAFVRRWIPCTGAPSRNVGQDLSMWQNAWKKEQERMKQIPETVKKDQILYYFKTQWTVLLAVTISGLIYNLGLLAEPWFEGRMTGCLVDILGGNAGYRDMLVLVTAYVISIAIVQLSRYIKRFFMSDDLLIM